MNKLQLAASDPAYSSFVSASAGTGKTKILIDRVLRLLLNNNHFAKIICLTFTNAAAGEMKERIAKILALWPELSKEELQQELFTILGRHASQEELNLAKKLYEQYLQLEEKVNIQTIHAFCQKLLKKFPLECGISPSFTIIDEIESLSLLKKIKAQLLNDASMQDINQYLNENFHEVIIDKIINEIIDNKIKFVEIKSEDISLSENIEQYLADEEEKWIQKTSSHSLIKQFFSPDQDKALLKDIFLTKTGQKRRRILSAKLAKPGSPIYLELEKIQEELWQFEQQKKSWQLVKHSNLILKLTQGILAKYEQYKQAKALLDYDDLIIHAYNLLSNNIAKDWVLYKLDGGIDHLLIDEAQDTSHYQWQIIEALMGEFYASETRERTIFIVGDAKQSIFSFQGADSAAFSQFNQLLSTKMQQSEKNFKNIELDISYRSAANILKIVEAVFSDIAQKKPELFANTITKLKPYRTKKAGSVELWPLITASSQEAKFWPIFDPTEQQISPEQKLAQIIAQFVAEKLASKLTLAATNEIIRPEDFMILFRTRDSFTENVINALKEKNIAVSGLDRISLADNIAVLDLLSIAKFVLDPKDDLNICSLLKSSIFNLSEATIYHLCQQKNQKQISIWQILCQNKIYSKISSQLAEFNQLFHTHHVGNFFHLIVDIFDYREQIKLSCGIDSEDAINELLHLAEKFSQSHSLSLQEFIFWFENYSNSVKRDIESAGKVKIMTMHAAKGLQAPIVILADTTSLPVQNDLFYWSAEGSFFTAKNADSAPAYFEQIKEDKKQATYAEYLRLLYVGMTRAEDHLIICGYQTGKIIPENCWYNLVKTSLLKLDIAQKNMGTENTEKDLLEKKLIIGSYPQNCSAPTHSAKNSSKQIIEKIALISDQTVKLSMKHPVINNNHTANHNYASPLAELRPTSYGLIFHKILEDAVNAKSLSLMKKHPLLTDMTSTAKKRMLASIDKIIANQKFQHLLEHEFYTELSLGRKLAQEINIGRIDLLIKKDNEIIIIDYKSDLYPPKIISAVPEAYLKQMECYRAMLRDLYPHQSIIEMIFWLENGELMQL